MRFAAVVLIASLSAPLWAAEPPAGSLSLKLNGPEMSVRQARQRLAVVEKDIARLERDIVDTRSQAQTARATGGTNSPQASVLASLASTYELQKAQLLSEREQLIGELKASKE